MREWTSHWLPPHLSECWSSLRSAAVADGCERLWIIAGQSRNNQRLFSSVFPEGCSLSVWAGCSGFTDALWCTVTEKQQPPPVTRHNNNILLSWYMIPFIEMTLYGLFLPQKNFLSLLTLVWFFRVTQILTPGVYTCVQIRSPRSSYNNNSLTWESEESTVVCQSSSKKVQKTIKG